MLTFDVIDVETANADRESICQIGVVHVREGEVVDEWKTLVNPEDWFDPFNISIHGIRECDVQNSPTIPKVYGELCSRLRDSVLVSHTSFDQVALDRATMRYGLERLQVKWLDSTKIVRRAWPDRYGQRGYGLKNVAKDLGISFEHHDALADAKAAAKIVLHACTDTETDIEDWLSRVDRPIFSSARVRHSRPTRSIKREGNVDGKFFGETVLFTGTLVVSRDKAADMAAEVGFNVAENINKKVTMLIVGTQDKNRLNGYEKSGKHRRAEKLVDQGVDIRILSENDFFELLRIDPSRIET